jgi:hypothetical protein
MQTKKSSVTLIALVVAMGGGMGEDINPALTSQKFILNYVRIYELK